MHGLSLRILAEFTVNFAYGVSQIRLDVRLVGQAIGGPLDGLVQNLPQYRRVAAQGNRWTDTLEHAFQERRDLLALARFQVRFLVVGFGLLAHFLSPY